MSYVPHSISDFADWISVALCFLGVSVLVLAVGWVLFRSAGCRWTKGVSIESPEKRDAVELFYGAFVVALLLPAVLLLYPKEWLIPLSALICGPLVIAYVSIFWSNRCGKRDVDVNQQSAEGR
jgi:hypothetical protein